MYGVCRAEDAGTASCSSPCRLGMELGRIIGNRRDYGSERFYRILPFARRESCRKDPIRGTGEF